MIFWDRLVVFFRVWMVLNLNPAFAERGYS